MCFVLDQQLQGFVHALSRVKNSKKQQPYFDLLIQTSQDEKVRAVCYDPKHRTKLHQAFEQKSPVKISGVKKLASSSFSDNSKEFKITKKSKITPSASPSFPYNPEISSSLMTVSQALSADVYKTVDVVAKVMNKQHNTQLIHKLGKQLMKADCIIADNTESIKLVLWQDLINKVECGKTYLFQDLKVRVFDDAKYLNTNESTVNKLSEQEIQEINLTSDELKDNLIEGQCVGVHFRKEKACVLCNNTLEKKDDGEEMVTCNSCNSTMLYI